MSFGVSVSGKENSYERYRTYRTERMLMLAELLGCERYINVDSHVYSVCVYPTPKHSADKPRLTVPPSQLSRVPFSDCTRERNSEYETSGAHSSECGRREQHRWGSSVEIFDWVAPALGRAHIPRVTTWRAWRPGCLLLYRRGNGRVTAFVIPSGEAIERFVNVTPRLIHLTPVEQLHRRNHRRTASSHCQARRFSAGVAWVHTRYGGG